MQQEISDKFDDLNKQFLERLRLTYDAILDVYRKRDYPDLSLAEVAEEIRPNFAHLIGLAPQASWNEIIKQEHAKYRWAVELGAEENWDLPKIMEAIKSDLDMEVGMRQLGNPFATVEEIEAFRASQKEELDQRKADMDKVWGGIASTIRSKLKEYNVSELGFNPSDSLDKLLVQLEERGLPFLSEATETIGPLLTDLYGLHESDTLRIRMRVLEFLSRY